MKVLLIAPPIRESLGSGLDDGMPKRISSSFGVFPHLGICYIAAVLRGNGIETEIIDINVEPLSREDLVRRVRDADPDLIGLSAMTFTFLYTLELARLIKSHMDVPVVIGGPHVSIYPDEVMTHSCFDIGVVGEGEYTALEVARALRGRKLAEAAGALAHVRGIVYRQDGRVLRTAPREFIRNLDELPFPAVDLLKTDRYYGCNLPRPYMTVMTSRGCPYRCSFCSKSPWGQSLRLHSPQRVVDELEHLVTRFGVRAVDFFDDTFTADKARTREITALMRQRGLPIEFGITTRVNTVTREILDDLKRAGCRTVAFGVESGDPETLRRVDKDITLDQIRYAFSTAAEAGINTVAFLLVGNPGESEEAVRNTIRLMKEVSPDYFISNILIPYPGSKLYDDLLSSGELAEDYWRKVTLEGRPLPTPTANRVMSRETMIRLRNRINRMPYFRLKTNLLKFRKIRSVQDVVRALTTLKTSLLDRSM